MVSKNVKDATIRPISKHYAVLERPMNRQAMPCYCNKRKDHELTPRTPLITDHGESWGGFEKGKEVVKMTAEGFIKVSPTPAVLVKDETPVFALVQREFNASNRKRMQAKAEAESLSLDD